MKLGEIKSEALYLSFANPELIIDSSDSEALCAALRDLKSDPNYSDFLIASVGAINRAISALELRGLSPLYTRELYGETDEITGGCILDLSNADIPMIFAEAVYSVRNGAYVSVPFESMGEGKLLLPVSETGIAYAVRYRGRIERVSALTSDAYELPLEDTLASIIPYFIKGDLLRSEDPEGAKASLEIFNSLCSLYPSRGEGASLNVYSIYSTEDSA